MTTSSQAELSSDEKVKHKSRELHIRRGSIEDAPTIWLEEFTPLAKLTLYSANPLPNSA